MSKNEVIHMTGKAKLLYVDDEKVHLTNFRAAFSDEYDILTVLSGKEALRVFRKNSGIAIVVADQRMPGMTGVELLSEVFQINPDPVRIILSAYTDEKAIMEAINQGHVYQFILKPWKRRELAILLHQAKETYSLAIENKELTNRLNAKNIDLEEVNNELKRANLQLAEDNAQLKKAETRIHTLTRELLVAQENERQRIAFHLHDSMAQDLSSLRILCDTLFDDFPEAPEGLRKNGREISKVLHKCIRTVRELSYELRPFHIEQLGFIQTVYQYCHDFTEKNSLTLNFHSAGMKGLPLDSEIEINLYRIVQEIFTNVKKHAHASEITMKLLASHPNIILRVKDNGIGFDVEKRLAETLQERRMGLQSMIERVKLLQGEISINSQLGKGAKIIIEIPQKRP